jgi:hypothetical protein
MTYQTEIEKVEQPLSAELYKILVGNVYTYFTSYGTDIVYGGNTYLTRPIKRSGFSVEKAMKTVDVTITIPIAAAFQEYLSVSPYAKTIVTITKVFVSSPDSLSKLIFTGMVHTVAVSKGVASVVCKSANALLTRKVPRIIYQTNCNWSLYSDDCGVVKTNHELISTVGSISGNDIVLNLSSSLPDTMLKGGTFVWGSEQRLITNQVGNTVTVLVQFAGIAVDDQVFLYPGCDGSYGACKGYGNQYRFMGMPHIPTKNALLWGFR